MKYYTPQLETEVKNKMAVKKTTQKSKKILKQLLQSGR